MKLISVMMVSVRFCLQRNKELFTKIEQMNEDVVDREN